MDNKTKYNPAIHHRRSIRLKGYDYSQNGLYFITICTFDRECLFGEIINKKMILNDAGKAANECWLKIPEHFPNAVLHEHVVMPNHVHGIIELNDTSMAEGENAGTPNGEYENGEYQNGVGVQNTEGIQYAVGVQNFEPLPPPTTSLPPLPPQNRFQHIIPRSIGSIVRGYKIGVTKIFRDNTDIYRVWQRNYHEHIIRSEQSYLRISEYVIDNPDVWEHDKFYR